MNSPITLVTISRAELDAALHQAARQGAQEVLAQMKKAEPAASPEAEVWDAAQVAEFLKMSPRTVSEKLSKRKGFPQPVGRKNRWLKADVLAWAGASGVMRRAGSVK